MTMKKRFLGLALAAMVAVPATTAYAATDSTTIHMGVNDTKTHDVKVSGIIKNSQGQAPEGVIEVELPTSMQFTVDQSGVFNGTDFNVTNKSQTKIDVSLANFTETNKDGGIKVFPMDTDLNSKTRENVALKLVGGKTEIDLANFAKGGITGEATKLLTVDANDGVGTITLTGKAGKAQASSIGRAIQGPEETSPVDSEGIKEDFKLVFQIKKSGK